MWGKNRGPKKGKTGQRGCSCFVYSCSDGAQKEPREKITGCLRQIALLCFVIRFVLAQGVEYGNVLREVLGQVVSRNAVLTVRDK